MVGTAPAIIARDLNLFGIGGGGIFAGNAISPGFPEKLLKNPISKYENHILFKTFYSFLGLIPHSSAKTHQSKKEYVKN